MNVVRLDRTKPSLFSVSQLIQHLDIKYPHLCIKPDESLANAHRRAGQRDVIDYLLWLDQLNDDDLPTLFEPETEDD
jgi:hypothetical protein